MGTLYSTGTLVIKNGGACVDEISTCGNGRTKAPAAVTAPAAPNPKRAEEKTQLRQVCDTLF